MKKVLNYESYRALSKKQKQKRIQEAQQNQKDRGPNPQGPCIFHELNWIDFKVMQKNKQIKLCTYRHQCIGEPVAVVIMLHGLNSYIGHGAHIAHYFAKHGIITVGFDHRGFGRSEGEPGYAQSLDLHVQDSLKFVKLIKEKYPNLPFFCLGLSMGGLTTYYLTLKYRDMFQGAIMMAPAIKNNIGGFLLGFAKTLASFLPKKMKLMKPIYGRAARNPTVTEDIKNDEFSFSQRARVSTIQMLLTSMDITPQTFPKYNCPFMIIQGGLDKLVNPDGAFELYDQSATKQQDKQLLFYEGMWHDVWHEPEITEIIQKTNNWILKRIKKLQRKQQHPQEKKQEEVQIKKQVDGQKISFKPDEHDLSKQIAVTQSQEIRLQEKLHDMQLKQAQDSNNKNNAVKNQTQPNDKNGA